MIGHSNSAAKLRLIRLYLVVSISCHRLFAAQVDTSRLPPPAWVQIDFARDIRPILEADCLRCHGPEKPKSRFRLDNRQAALKGGENGPDILPGNSAKSPLILFVAGLVPDSEMPPPGKGKQLTPEQVSLLRAWIDQGVVWDTAAPSNNVAWSLSPTIGGTVVKGDSHKFREHYWQREGLNGGLEQFELFQQTDPNTKVLVTGHALLDDYKVVLSLDRNDLGFIHTGWDQYRKYFDDTGLYFPSLAPSTPRLNEDLHLDIGRAWFDVGLTLPNWPRLVLGYEYDYKLGDEATTQWSTVGAIRATARNIAPASKSIHEDVHVIKFDLDYEFSGITLEDRFRGEFYNLHTSLSNVAFRLLPQKVSEDTTYFQGANTLTLEKKFADWLFGSAGYLYSKLNTDAAFMMETPTLFTQIGLPRIVLERESHVGNVNGLIGPFYGLVFSAGGQAEWTRQNGFGDGSFDQEPPPPPVSSLIVPFNVASEYDTTAFLESLALRFSKIPFTSLFAEARFEQRYIGQYDQFSASEDVFNKAIFLQHTDFSSGSSDVRFGFSTSPWRAVSLSAHYRRYDNVSHYDSDPLVQPVSTAYPTFIRSRDLLTDEAEGKLSLQPATWLKTMLSYQYRTSEYDLDTHPFLSFGNVISPGGPLVAGKDHSHMVSFNATITPFPRLYLSTTFSYLTSSSLTASDNSPAIVPYRGDVYSVLADGTYVLNQTSDLFASYAFSAANYGQHNFAGGVPLGIDYHQHGVQVGLKHRFGKRISGRLQYRFAHYDEPTSGGAVNYEAHSVFATISFLLR